MAEALGTVASIIAVLGLAKSAVSLLRDIKDASAQCNSLVTEISFTRGLLAGLKDTISDLDTARSWTQTIQLLAQPDGPISCLEKVLHVLNDKLTKQATTSNSKNIMRNMLWPFSKRESEEILRSIERQKVSLLLALENNHIRLAMAIREDTKQNGQDLKSLQEDVKEVIEGISNIGISFEDHLSLDILSWISPFNTRTAHDQIYNGLAPGTGEWLLATPEFKAWVAGDVKTLFCPGIPGAGKSSLASQIIRYLETRANLTPESHSVAWIYCDYRESSVHSTLLFIASLLKQTLQNIRPIPSSVKDLYKSHGKGSTSITLVEARDILQKIVADRELCFIVIDALDECTELDGTREHLVKELRSLKPPISLLVTSRPILSIETMFSDATVIRMEPNKEDLDIYIDRRLETETKLHKIVQADQLLQKEIKATLVAKNQGIFLMTKLHLDALAKKAKHSKKALRDALADLPLDLDKTYEDAMARIAAQDEEDARLAVQVLSWVLISFRRMTVRELQGALAVQSDYDEDDEESLIDPEFFISLTRRHINLKKLTRSPETAMNEFTEYAVRYAMLHVNASWESGLFNSIASLWKSGHLDTFRKAFDYLTNDGTALTDLEEKSLIHPYSEFTRLQLAVMYGFDMEAEAMIGKGFPKDELGTAFTQYSQGTQTPAVCIAIHNHNLHVLDLLLKAGARLDVLMVDRKESRLTALECAIAREDQEMVKFLLDRSPILKTYHPYEGRSALHFAVASHLHELASYLLGDDIGLAVDEKDEYGQTALHYLVRGDSKCPPSSHFPTFKVLQEASANINACDFFGRTPLDYIKARNKNNQTHELHDTFVNQGAIVGCWGKKLQVALTWGSQADAKLLLDENANVNALPESVKHGLLRLLLSRRRVLPSDLEPIVHLECSLATALVELGASIRSPIPGETDLHWIIRHLGESQGKTSFHYIAPDDFAKKYDQDELEFAGKTHLHVLSLLMPSVNEINVVFNSQHHCTWLLAMVKWKWLNCFSATVPMMTLKALLAVPSRLPHGSVTLALSRCC